MAEAKTAQLAFSFTSHPSTSSFGVPCQTYLSTHKHEHSYHYIATGALVFDASTPPRILLIQRAFHDSMPSLWEVPGGGCDDEDSSILHGVARELWEEAGLTASRIGPQVGEDHVFPSRSGKIVCKFNFLVEAEKSEDGNFDVKLDTKEHQAFVWATEDEVEAKKAGDVKLDFTTIAQENVILEAFRMRRETNANSKST
jgi:8-oxo-dGTP pyrophosphatase MutT (NUDIX family)